MRGANTTLSEETLGEAQAFCESAAGVLAQSFPTIYHPAFPRASSELVLPPSGQTAPRNSFLLHFISITRKEKLHEYVIMNLAWTVSIFIPMQS